MKNNNIMKAIIDKKQNVTMLRHGWQAKAARDMKVHPNTIYNILKEGERHPLYAQLMHVAKKYYR